MLDVGHGGGGDTERGDKRGRAHAVSTEREPNTWSQTQNKVICDHSACMTRTADVISPSFHLDGLTMFRRMICGEALCMQSNRQSSFLAFGFCLEHLTRPLRYLSSQRPAKVQLTCQYHAILCFLFCDCASHPFSHFLVDVRWGSSDESDAPDSSEQARIIQLVPFDRFPCCG